MARTILDDELKHWEAFASTGRYGYAERARRAAMSYIGGTQPKLAEAIEKFYTAVEAGAWSHEPDAMKSVPGLFAAGECAAGINGANRLGGNSLSDLLVFGKRAGEFAARFARENGPGGVDEDQVSRAAGEAVAPFERPAATEGDGPYAVQRRLQESMQDLVGIVRREDEMRRALVEIEEGGWLYRIENLCHRKAAFLRAYHPDAGWRLPFFYVRRVVSGIPRWFRRDLYR